MRAVPPSARPTAGKRRPRPHCQAASQSPGPRRAIEDPSEALADSREESDRLTAEEVARLRHLVGELTLRCQNHEQELLEFRQRQPDPGAAPGSLEGLPLAAPRLRAASPAIVDDVVVVADSHSSVEQACQTEDGIPPESSHAASEVRQAQMTYELEAQLDSMHREVGDKTREIRKVQDTVRMLRAELQQERLVSDQYRVQVELLETQCHAAQQMLRHAPVDDSPRHGASSRSGTPGAQSRSGTPRPASARVTKAWGEGSPSSRASGSAKAVRSPATPGRPHVLQSLNSSSSPRQPMSDGNDSTEEDSESSDDEDRRGGKSCNTPRGGLR